MTATTRNFLLLHLPANAVLLLVSYQWLSVGESSVATLVESLLVGLLVLLMASWLHGATFASFRKGAAPGVTAAFRIVLRHLLPLMLVVIGAIAIYSFLTWWAGYSVNPATNLASWLTFHFRKPVKPSTVLRIFSAALWMVRWVLLPADLLPLFSGVASRGWRGFGEFGWRRYSRLYRLEVPLLVLCAAWLPFRLIGWVPHVEGFSLEMTSLVARATVGYLLFVCAAMVLAFLTSQDKPAEG